AAAARELETKQLAMYDIILTISQAHHAHCGFTEEKTRGLIRKPALLTANEIKLDSGSTADSMEMERLTMWQHFAGLVTPSIQDIVEFAKRIPGFLEFAQDDQLILIKLGFFEVWLIHVSRSILAEEDGSRGAVTFAGGAYVTREQLEFVCDIDFTSSMFNFFSSFNGLSLNDTEIGLFCAVALLTFSERTTLFDARTVEQCRLVEALKLQVIRNHPSDRQLFSPIIAKLPELL
ncbi:ecdysone-induced protein 78C-like, partial [Galendromus occidentalis]|uniref:Ecdysone-induced protein 78C-like n=1 Tax=Galendromus occidentalis TaxID=34638 RepID=A0AAJ7SCZ0_9ACAR